MLIIDLFYSFYDLQMMKGFAFYSNCTSWKSNMYMVKTQKVDLHGCLLLILCWPTYM